MNSSRPFFAASRRTGAVAGVFCLLAGVAQAAPPAPRDGVDYQLVLAKPPQGDVVEIRRRGDIYRHALVGETGGGVILYRASTGEAAVMEREAIYMMEMSPSELGGFDAPAMMAGLVEGPVAWSEGGTREIAETMCTEHTGSGTREGAPVEATFCVTEDGIILSIRVGGAGQVGRMLEASELRIGNQPLELFDFPVIPEEAREAIEAPDAVAPAPAE